MARIRSIKPEFPQSETMGRLSRDARLLFVLLWTIVDDDGRARAASRMLASLLYPYDDDAPKQIERWLKELEGRGCIRRYEVDGSKYLDIPNWLKHQKIDRPTPSRLPGYREPATNPREPSRALDADLGPRTLDQEEDLGSKNSREAREDDWPSDYREQFWNAYPRKISKETAYKALERVRRDGKVTWCHLLAGVMRYAAANTETKFIKHPTTWLNGGCWDDDPAAFHTPYVNGHAPRPGSKEAQRQEERDALDQLTKFYQSDSDGTRGSRSDGRPDAPVLPFHRRA